MKWSAQLLAWSATLVLARVLTPADYGLMGMATVFLNLIYWCDFGIGTAIVVANDVHEAMLSQLNTMAVLVGMFCFGISFACARPISWFFGVPTLPYVIVAMSLVFALSGFATVPTSLLQRRMQFKLLAGLEITRALVTAGVSIGLALAGWRYWSLVWGDIAGTAAFTLLVVRIVPQCFSWPQRETVRQPLRVGKNILLSSLSLYAYTNSDFVVAGRRFGQASLGSYTIAWNVASVPVQRVSALISRVSPAFFSAVQTNYSELRRYLLRLTEAISLITFPAAVGLALVATDFVPVVFGNKWHAAVMPLRLLALATTVRCITFLVPQVLNVIDESWFGMLTSVTTAIVLPAGFYMASRWGIGGIAAVWLVIYPLMCIPNYWRIMNRIELHLAELVDALRPAVTGTAVMAAFLLLIKFSLPGNLQQGLRLSAEVAGGALAYLAFTMAAYSGRIMAVWRTVRANC